MSEGKRIIWFSARIVFLFLILFCKTAKSQNNSSLPIDRFSLVTRHNLIYNHADSSQVMTVGNGEIAFGQVGFVLLNLNGESSFRNTHCDTVVGFIAWRKVWPGIKSFYPKHVNWPQTMDIKGQDGLRWLVLNRLPHDGNDCHTTPSTRKSNRCVVFSQPEQQLFLHGAE